ncbi:MAG: hypothetical protein PVI01_03430 [Gemmatimonadales bacterium]|jgi:hypothetical protein
MNGKPKSLALALLVGALLVGGVVGVVVDRSLIRERAADASADRANRDRDRRQSYVDWLTAELQLSQDQREHVAAVLERNRTEVRALWQETRPAFEKLKTQLRAQIRELLTEEQQAAYDSLLVRERNRHRSRR